MKLSELFELDDRLPEGAGELLPEGALPPDAEARILARMLEKAGPALPEKGKAKRMKKTKFGLMLFAAALCVGTVAASAAAYFQADRGLAKRLGAEAESWQEFLNSSGTAIQTSQEREGWTLTVNQAVGDRNCAYILLDLTAPEGTVLGADYYRLDCMLDFDGVRSGSWGCQMLEDEDRTDNKLSFVLDASMDTDLRNTTAHLTASGLMELIEHGEGSEDDEVSYPVELEWTFDFPLRYKNDPVVYQPNQTISMEGGSVRVERVEVTPLSVRVNLTGEKALLERVELSTAAPGEGAILLEARDREGGPLDFRATSCKEGLGSLTAVGTFRPILEPDGVSAIVLGGVEVPLG